MTAFEARKQADKFLSLDPREYKKIINIIDISSKEGLYEITAKVPNLVLVYKLRNDGYNVDNMWDTRSPETQYSYKISW